MSSRVWIFLGVLVAWVLLISSEVSARKLAETTSKEEDATSLAATLETNDVNDAKYGGYGGGYPGGGHERYPGHGGSGGGRGGYPGRRGYGQSCRYGCCGHRGYYGGDCKCCTYAGEAAETEPELKPQN